MRQRLLKKGKFWREKNFEKRRVLKERAVVLVSRAALSEWYFYFYYDFKVTLWI